MTSELAIEKVIQHHKKEAAAAGNTVCVVFGSIRERDLVLSHASNLQPGNSIDIVIPDNLYSLQRHLEHFAYRVRQNARLGRSQRKIFTSVRLCNATSSLRLAVRDDKTKPWTYYSREELKQLDSSLQKIPVVTNPEDVRST